MTSRILLTGFKPFLGETINPSERILEALRGDPAVRTLLLPVVFAEAAPLLLETWRTEGPFSAVLMLGQAGRRDRLSLERVALNWIETEHPDESGACPPRGPIEPGGEGALLSEFPLEVWRKELSEMGIPTEVSLSAGGYVCNDLYFKVRRALGARALFVHVPFLPEQAARAGSAKGETVPSMPLETMVTAVRELVKRLG